jgi:hypothetical protein
VAKKQRSPAVNSQCAWCGKRFSRTGRTIRKTYCSPAHRQAAFQQRFRENKGQSYRMMRVAAGQIRWRGPKKEL